VKSTDDKKKEETVIAVETKDFKEGEACSFDPVTGQRTGDCAD
jgi:hypothetical protein